MAFSERIKAWSYEDNIEPYLHLGSWVLLVAVPLLVLAVARLRLGTTASDP